MSLGLYLKGHFMAEAGASPQVFDRDKLLELEKWLSNVAFDELEWTQWTEDEDGNPCLMVQLHPGAEPIMLSPYEDGSLLIAAATSSAGPGYHIFVCDLIRKLAQVHRIEFAHEDDEEADETGFFDTGDKAILYAEFEAWIGALTKRVNELSKDGGKFHLAMPLEGHQFDVPEPILTQLGPRDMQWLEAVMADNSLGRDMFPWWEDGHGAEYHLGRALCYMWGMVRWREPLTEGEAELLEKVLHHLDSAFNLDADLAYPWKEWAEIIDYLGCDYEYGDQVETKADAQPEPVLIGYRRRGVRKKLGGGWSVAFPGDFAEELEEEQTFLAYDETRTIRVTCMSASDNSGNSLEPLEILQKIKVFDDPLQFQNGQIHGRAFFERAVEDDAAFWMLRGASAASGTFALITICFETEAEQQWAIDTWKSLEHRIAQRKA